MESGKLVCSAAIVAALFAAAVVFQQSEFVKQFLLTSQIKLATWAG